MIARVGRFLTDASTSIIQIDRQTGGPSISSFLIGAGAGGISALTGMF